MKPNDPRCPPVPAECFHQRPAGNVDDFHRVISVRARDVSSVAAVRVRDGRSRVREKRAIPRGETFQGISLDEVIQRSFRRRRRGTRGCPSFGVHYWPPFPLFPSVFLVVLVDIIVLLVGRRTRVFSVVQFFCVSLTRCIPPLL